MIDQKEKEKWIDEMLEQYPTLKYDALKRHVIEQLIDSYQANPKAFRECVNSSKNTKYEQKQLPTEIICISKIADKEIIADDNSIIKVV